MNKASKRKAGKAKPAGRHKFTRAECQLGFQRAKEKCDRDWNLAAWFFRRVRGYYRHKEEG